MVVEKAAAEGLGLVGRVLGEPMFQGRMMSRTAEGRKRWPDGIYISIPAWFVGFVGIPVMLIAIQNFIDMKDEGEDILPDWVRAMSPLSMFINEDGSVDQVKLDATLTATSPAYAIAKAASGGIPLV